MREIRILLCVALLLLSGCMTETEKKETTLKKVKVESVEPYTHGLFTDFVGKIVSNKEISSAFRIAGTIESIPVELGQQVRKGKTVAILDSRDYRTQLSATEAEYIQVKAEAERITELYNRKSVPRNDYDKAVSGLKQITAKLTAHRDALADCSIKAPIDGRIQKIIYTNGETVNAGMPVITMVSNSSFEVEFFVPSSYYSKLEGDHFCTIPKYSDKKYALEFISILPKANASGLYAVRFKIKKGKEDKLLSGMSSIITINHPLNPLELVTIPLSSIFEKDGDSYIWVYNDEDNRVKLRKIKPIKLLNSGYLVIEDSVKVGEQVVVAGVNSINEQTAVKSLPKVSSTNIGGVK